jgi:hypothetical protein
MDLVPIAAQLPALPDARAAGDSRLSLAPVLHREARYRAVARSPGPVLGRRGRDAHYLPAFLRVDPLPGDSRRSDSLSLLLLGVEVFTFDPLSFLGWAMFHGLDATAVLVIAGCGYFLLRRFKDREATTGERLGYDLFPLIALVAISITGLLLTFSSLLLEGAGYEFLAITHMATVVLTLVFIPFGKFFHVIQRPAQLGVDVFKRSSIEKTGVFSCRRCGQPLEAGEFVSNLQETMDELGLGFSQWAETCPRCKRVQRGEAYLQRGKGGFSS